MELKKSKLLLVKDALIYGTMFSKSESETAEFALLLVEVTGKIEEEKQQEKYVETLKSLDGCPFHYCDRNPKCDGKCRYA